MKVKVVIIMITIVIIKITIVILMITIVMTRWGKKVWFTEFARPTTRDPAKELEYMQVIIIIAMIMLIADILARVTMMMMVKMEMMLAMMMREIFLGYSPPIGNCRVCLQVVSNSMFP